MTTNFPSAPEAALAAIAGDYGLEQPNISRAGWLDTLLREIEETPGVKDLLGGDPESRSMMLMECRRLANDGLAIMELLSPRIGAIVEGNRARLVDDAKTAF